MVETNPPAVPTIKNLREAAQGDHHPKHGRYPGMSVVSRQATLPSKLGKPSGLERYATDL